MTEPLVDAESYAALARASADGSALPLPSQVLFWRARHLRDDPFVHHLPFAFWLVEALAPQRIVTIGLGSGVAHFGLAQAVDKLGLACRCLGFENWEDGVPASLAEHNTRNYDDFSRLEAAALSDIAPRIAEGSVDLLLLDTALDAEAIAALSHDWPAKMSPRGLILIHRPGRLTESPEGRGFRERLHRHYPVIALAGGAGLEAILYGPRQPDRLRRLARLGADDPDRTGVEAVFARLGGAHHYEWAAGAEAARARKARDEATALRKRAEAAEAAEETLRTAWETRSDQIARLQAHAFDRETALEEKRAAAERARDAAATKVAELEAALQTRFREIADLTTAAEAERKAAADRETALDEKCTAAEARAVTAEAALTETRTRQANAERVREETATKVAGLEAALQTRFREIADLTRAAEAERKAAADREAAARQAAKAAEKRWRLLLTLKTAQSRLRPGRGDPFRGTGLPPLREQLRILRAAPLFDAEWYLATYSDVKSAGQDPAEHYLRYGTYEGRNPSPDFHTLAYYSAYPDAAKKGLAALVHASIETTDAARPAVPNKAAT